MSVWDDGDGGGRKMALWGGPLSCLSGALGALLLLTAAASAASSGRIAGTVTDGGTGAPLIGAYARLADTGRAAATDARGRYRLLNIPPGSYTLAVTHVGYSAFSLQQVTVSAGLTSRLDVELSVASIPGAETVVRAKPSLIDPSATNAVRILRGDDLSGLVRRGVQEALALQAGVVRQDGQLHVRGSRPDEIGWFADGAAVRNPVTGRVAVHLIDEALAEIQLQAGGFNAEYGGANAGIVLHELRLGAPEWQVGLLAESDRFAPPHRTRLGTHSYGYSNQVLTLGGPVAGNERIRAFAAGQRLVQDSEPVFWEGFRFDDLVDSGNRGGAVHWGSPETPDTVDLAIRPGRVDHSGRETLAGNATLFLDYYPFQVRLTGLSSLEEEELNPAPVRSALNLGRLPEEERRTELVNLRLTHFLDAATYYQVALSRYRQSMERLDPSLGEDFMLYNDSLAVARADPAFSPYLGQGLWPQPYDLHGFPVDRAGTPTNFYGKGADSYWGLAGTLSKQSGPHALQFGVAYEGWTARRYNIFLGGIRGHIRASYPNLESVYQRYHAGDIDADQVLAQLIAAAQQAPPGAADLDTLQTLIRAASSGDFFGYDEFGRESAGTGLEAPRHPTLASAYVQDRAEYGDLIVNAGVRWDYFDVDSWRFRDPAAPARDAQGFTVDLSSMRKTRRFHELSPRLGLAFPVSERTVFHLQYGRFAQMPALRDMYVGGARLAAELGTQGFVRTPTGFDIEPVRTTQYEIGFERQFAGLAAVDLTGFYRDVRGQLQLRRQELSAGAVNANAYNFVQNGDFATVKGLELACRTRRINRFRALLNYTLSEARGTGSSVGAAVSAVENATDLPTVVSPLDFNQTHRGNVQLEYRFGSRDGGPILARSGVSLLAEFTSGHNFTRVEGSLGQRGPEEGGILASDDPRHRKPTESINASTTPWTFEVDLRVHKGFTLFGVDGQVYVYAMNLLDRRNVVNVYGRTGNAGDDGFLTDPELSSGVAEAHGGQAYRALYEAINLRHRQHYWAAEGGDLYGSPRQVRFGLRLGR